MRSKEPSFILGTNFLILVTLALVSTGTLWASQYKVIYTFQGGNDGSGPSSPLIYDAATGGLYGTTGSGGSETGCGGAGCGTVFELTPHPDGSWTETILYAFAGLSGDGAFPGSLLRDSAGNLFGFTSVGGPCDKGGCGSIFELTQNPDGTWSEMVLFDFPTEADGSYPDSLVMDASGSLYGTTLDGGASNVGTAFQLTRNPDGTWTHQVIHNFTFDKFGFEPSGVTPDGKGNLFGMTYGGGAPCPYDSNGCGTVFELSPSGGSWTYSVLYRFRGLSDGGSPNSAPIFDAAGNLYGTTTLGGDLNCNANHLGCGTLFRAVPGRNGIWSADVLHRFTNGPDGAYPYATVVFDKSGNLYGSAASGSYFGFGSLYEATPAPGGHWAGKLLHAFRGFGDGAFPNVPVTFDPAGNLFGSAAEGGLRHCGPPNYDGCGAVFEITP